MSSGVSLRVTKLARETIFRTLYVPALMLEVSKYSSRETVRSVFINIMRADFQAIFRLDPVREERLFLLSDAISRFCTNFVYRSNNDSTSKPQSGIKVFYYCMQRGSIQDYCLGHFCAILAEENTVYLVLINVVIIMNGIVNLQSFP